MARFARVVVPSVPHHVTQRGVRRMQVFFSNDDYAYYTRLLASQAERYELEIWTYCLMPNHVHLVTVPSSRSGLARPIGEAHRRYALAINRRHRCTGHLWQERFASFAMEEGHLLAAARYVLLNPVRAGLVKRPEDWPHSSARAHLFKAPNPLVNRGPLDQRIEDWRSYLAAPTSHGSLERIRQHTRTGRPLGSVSFVKKLEQQLDRRLRPRPPGPAPRAGR